MSRESIVTIVGGGIAGTIAAIRLIEETKDQIVIHIFDERGAFREGVGYTKESAGLLLNVPCFHMGIYPNCTDDFLNWMKEKAIPLDAGPFTFCDRTIFSDYVKARWGEALKLACRKNITVLEFKRRVVDIRVGPAGIEVEDSVGTSYTVAFCLLATGPSPVLPEYLSGLDGSPKVARTIFRLIAEDVGVNERIAFVGTGLSMVDGVAILKNRGHKGPVYAFSRRGLIPASHATSDYPVQLREVELPAERRLSKLVHRVKSEAKQGNWKSVMQSLRPLTPAIWSGLSELDKNRFFRHIKPYWDVHRHRMPPASDLVVRALRQRGQLKVIGARITKVTSIGEEFKIAYKERKSQLADSVTVDRIIVSSGFDCGIGDPRHILRKLVSRKLASANKLGLGLCTDSVGRVLDRRIFAVGWPRLGQDFETTAIPEVRLQVELAIKSILRDMDRRNSRPFVEEKRV